MTTILDVVADGLRERETVLLNRRGSWALVVVAFPNGLPTHQRRPCEQCGGHKRRLRSQFWVRWLDQADVNQGFAHLACSFSCATEMASRLVFPPDKRYSTTPILPLRP